MEKLAIRIACKLALELKLDDENRDVIAYGLTALIQIVVTFFLVFLFGFLAGVSLEALTVCLSVSSLRKYSGGAHADSIELCTFLAVVYSVSAAAFSFYLLTGLFNIYGISILSLCTYIAAFYLVYNYAPVDSPNKPIKTERKKARMRRGAFAILFLYTAASGLLILLPQKRLAYSLNLSILLGILWQTFSLTRSGAQFYRILGRAIKLKWR